MHAPEAAPGGLRPIADGKNLLSIVAKARLCAAHNSFGTGLRRGIQRMDSLLDPATAIEAVDRGLAEAGYIASRQISTAVFLAQRLDKPILVEGPAGVGKTELAKSIAAWQNINLIRMQCYEGLDESKALYEWKYAK